MTSNDPSTSPFPAGFPSNAPSPAARGSLWWSAIEAAVERMSEQLNPILVKEARQALKSKQFVITFTLLLLAGWVWSMLGVALLSPGVYYAPGGRFMLSGYFIVLAIPVLVIVPFSAFRSLASEREDGTFDLLSITSLSARQIVTGKLGSAMLQMLVYYSALAPCIAFTYLLRGIDIITIGFLLFYTLTGSIVLSAFGLVVATASRARHWQALISVLLLIVLLFTTIMWIWGFISLINTPQANAFDDLDFWLAQAAIVTFCISHVVLFVQLAASQISFASDNRSTRLRVILLIQQVLWVGWMMFFWVRWEEEAFLIITVAIAGLYWFVAGSLMMGESGVLSPRVKRRLPQSFLGRMCFTWFNPGSGTGYTFAVTNMLAVVFVVAVSGAISEIYGFARGTRSGDWLSFVLLSGAYTVGYLGVGRLVALLLHYLGRVTMLLTVLVNFFLAVIGVAVPLFFHAWMVGYTRLTYTSLQATNWIWTLEEVVDNDLGWLPLGIVVVAGFIFCLNLVFTMFEVEQTRMATPVRVLEDNRQLAPDRTAKPKPQSPWDESTTS